MSNSTKYIVAAFTTLSLLTPLAAGAQSTDLQAQIAALLAQIQTLQAQLSAQQSGGVAYSFTRDLTVGSKGDDVKALQQMLNSKGYTVAASGAGAAGNETTYFGALTKAALVKYQAAMGVSPTSGYFGPITRAKIASGTVPSTPSTPGGTTTPITGSVTVSIAPGSPAAATIADGSAYNEFLKLNFANGTSGSVSITSLIVTRGGISVDTNVTGVGLYGADGSRYGNVVESLASGGKATFNLSSTPIVLAAGMATPVWVKVNVSSATQSGTMRFGIASASDVKLSAGTVAGSFPLTGSDMSIVDGVNTLGGLTIDAVQVVSNGSIDATVSSVTLGTTGYEVAKLRFAAGAAEDVLINKIRVYNNGSVGDTDLANLSLYGPDGALLVKAGPVSNKYSTFDLSASPYKLPKGVSRDLSIRVDFVGGSTRTSRFQVQNDYDIVATGNDTKSGILATLVGGGTPTGNDRAFPVGDQAGGGSTIYVNKFTVAAGTFTLNKSSTSPSSDIPLGGTGVVLAKWDAKAAGEDMEIRQIAYTVSSSGAIKPTGTVKLQMDDGTVVYSIAGSSITLGSATTVSLTTYATLTANVAKTISLVVDISSLSTGNPTFTGTLDITQVRRVSSNDIVDPTVNPVAGNALTVKQGSLSVSNNSSAPAVTVVAGSATPAVLGSWNFVAGAAEGVNLTQIQVTVPVGFGRNYKDLELWMGGVKVSADTASTISPGVTDAAVTFTLSPQKTIAAAATAVLELRGRALSTTTDGTQVASIAASGVSGSLTVSLTSLASTPAVASASYNVTNSAAGTLAVARDTVTNLKSSQYVAGQTGITLGAFKLTANNAEDVKIKKLTLVNSGSVATGFGPNIGVYEQGASSPIANITVASLGTDGTFTFDYSSAPYTVPKNSSKVLVVKADTAYTATAGGTVELAVSRLEAQGADSSAAVYPSITSAASTATFGYTLNAGDVVFASNGTVGACQAATAACAGSSEAVTAGATSIGAGSVLKGVTLNTTAPQITRMLPRQYNGANVQENPSATAKFPYAVGDVIAYTQDSTPANNGLKVVTTAVAAGATLLSSDTLGIGLTPLAADRISKVVSGYSEAASATAGAPYNIGDIVVVTDVNVAGNSGVYVVANAIAQGGNMTLTAAGTRMLTLRNSDFLVTDRVAKLQYISTEAPSTAASVAYAIGDVVVVEDVGTVANNGAYVVKVAVAAGGDLTAANALGTGITFVAGDRISKLYSTPVNDNVVQIFPANLKFAWGSTSTNTSGAQVEVARFTVGANAANANNPNATVSLTSLAFTKSGVATLTNWTLRDDTNGVNVATNANGPTFSSATAGGAMAAQSFNQGETRTYIIKADIGTNGTNQNYYLTFQSGQFNSQSGNSAAVTSGSATWTTTNNAVTTTAPLWTVLAANVAEVNSPAQTIGSASDTTAPTLSTIVVTNNGT
ncbi:MAG: peptidoglycan-binding domain-containing protein, partial [Patescibacteria group bacterium]